MKTNARSWRRGFFVSAGIALAIAGTLLPYLTPSTEMVRLRNALILDPTPAAHDWTPENPPNGFRVERSPPNAVFAGAVAEHNLAVPGDDWETALRIGRHLLRSVDKAGAGGPIQKDLVTTYRRIVDQGHGTCAGFVDAFTGLATAAGLFTRIWAFSFDGFGGHGHTFPEIWDRQAGKWRLLDVFGNYVFHNGAGEPLSAMAFRNALLSGKTVDYVPLVRTARPYFVHEKVRDNYYSRGLHEWYLWWGNDVFDYDANRLVQAAGRLSRTTEQLTAIALKVFPPFRVLPGDGVSAKVSRMTDLERRLLLTAVGFAVAASVALACAIGWGRALKRGRRGALTDDRPTMSRA